MNHIGAAVYGTLGPALVRQVGRVLGPGLAQGNVVDGDGHVVLVGDELQGLAPGLGDGHAVGPADLLADGLAAPPA